MNRDIFDLVQNIVNMVVFLSTLPMIMVWHFLKPIFNPDQKSRPWRRVVVETTYRWLIVTQKISFIAFLIGPCSHTYSTWCKHNSVEPCVEDIEGGAQLFWIGDKRPERAFYISMVGDSRFQWDITPSNFGDSSNADCTISVAMLVLRSWITMLKYGSALIPDAHFPVPLAQSVAAVNHLLQNGVRSENIQIAGDSAGGNLVMQLLLHMLHPLDGVQRLTSDIRLRGAYLMSPWLYLIPRDGINSYIKYANNDIVPSKEKYAEFGFRVLNGVGRKEDLPYIDASHTPSSWYKNIDGVIDRVLITAGGHESLKDDIVEFSNTFRKAHKRTEVEVDAIGVHDDPFNDFMLGEDVTAELTPKIVQWFAQGFR